MIYFDNMTPVLALKTAVISINSTAETISCLLGVVNKNYHIRFLLQQQHLKKIYTHVIGFHANAKDSTTQML